MPTLAGESIDLYGEQGRPVVLHLFTTWSLASQLDIPQLEDAQQEFGERALIVGLALDREGAGLVGPWRRANQITYKVALGGGDIAAGASPLGRIREVPTTVILSPDGRVAHWLARPLKERELRRLLQSLLASR